MGNAALSAFLTLGVTLTLITAQAMADPPGTKMTADDIRRSLIGHTTYGKVNGLPYVQYIATDGTQKIRMANFNDTGTWRITDDGLLCRKWRISTSGKEECVAVYRSGETFYSVTPEGAVRATYTAVEGNPERL